MIDEMAAHLPAFLLRTLSYRHMLPSIENFLLRKMRGGGELVGSCTSNGRDSQIWQSGAVNSLLIRHPGAGQTTATAASAGTSMSYSYSHSPSNHVMDQRDVITSNNTLMSNPPAAAAPTVSDDNQRNSTS